MVFVHGGYWLRFDRSFWSHLAKGSVDSGYAVAMPSYTLCPDIRIAGITQEIGRAIEHAAGAVDGPLYLTGHSAGGHLVSRMVCADSPLSEATRSRLRNVVSISGVHDVVLIPLPPPEPEKIRRPGIVPGNLSSTGRCSTN